MKKSELAGMTVTELKALAQKKKVSLSAGGKKADIVNALIAVAKVVKPVVRRAAITVKKAAKKTAPKTAAKPGKGMAKKDTDAKKQASAPMRAQTTPVRGKKLSPAVVAKVVKPVAKQAAKIVAEAARNTIGSVKAAVKKAVKSGKSAAVKNPDEKKRAVAKTPVTTTPVREWKLPPGAEEPLMAQERIAESKYYTGPARQAPSVASGELPQGYGDEKVTLLSRDPFVAYAYWEVTPARIEREKKWFGWDSKICVRIYDITGVQFDGRNAIGYYDQEVFERAGSWYFDFGRPAHSFCADLGLLSTGGRFLTIARSNYITMPRDAVSEVIDEEWMMVDEEFWKLYGYEGSRRGVSSPEMQEMLKRRREMEITSPGLFSADRAKRK
jgi:hypothetical protein